MQNKNSFSGENQSILQLRKTSMEGESKNTLVLFQRKCNNDNRFLLHLLAFLQACGHTQGTASARTPDAPLASHRWGQSC